MKTTIYNHDIELKTPKQLETYYGPNLKSLTAIAGEIEPKKIHDGILTLFPSLSQNIFEQMDLYLKDQISVVLKYPETGLNPKEQQSFVTDLITLIDKRNKPIHIILETNSLWLLSEIFATSIYILKETKLDITKIGLAGNLYDIASEISEFPTGNYIRNSIKNIQNEKSDPLLFDQITDEFLKHVLKK